MVSDFFLCFPSSLVSIGVSLMFCCLGFPSKGYTKSVLNELTRMGLVKAVPYEGFNTKIKKRHSYVLNIFCGVVLCYVMLCYVMLCYVMLCYVMLCYVMLFYVMSCYVVS